MIKKRQIILLVTVLLACIFFINGVYALDAKLNASITEVKAAICINDSKDIKQLMADEGFNVLSIEDNIKQAEATYVAQGLLKEKKSNYDFALVFPYCDTVKQIREDALAAQDEVNSLMMFYNDSIIPGMDTTTIDAMINDVNDAIKNERYTEVSAIVEKTYTEITTVRSSYTALNIFYKSTARGIMAFLTSKNRILQIANWQFLTGLVVLILILLLIYRVQIRKMRLNRQLSKLINRKKTIKELVMKTQKDYFQYGKIPEGEYNIKTKRFAELIRDIDRQIPLVQEELAKISGGAKNICKKDSAVEKEKERVKIKPRIIANKSAKKPEKIKKAKHKVHIKIPVKHHRKIIKAKKKL